MRAEISPDLKVWQYILNKTKIFYKDPYQYKLEHRLDSLYPSYDAGILFKKLKMEPNKHYTAEIMPNNCFKVLVGTDTRIRQFIYPSSASIKKEFSVVYGNQGSSPGFLNTTWYHSGNDLAAPFLHIRYKSHGQDQEIINCLFDRFGNALDLKTEDSHVVLTYRPVSKKSLPTIQKLSIPLAKGQDLPIQYIKYTDNSGGYYDFTSDAFKKFTQLPKQQT